MKGFLLVVAGLFAVAVWIDNLQPFIDSVPRQVWILASWTFAAWLSWHITQRATR